MRKRHLLFGCIFAVVVMFGLCVSLPWTWKYIVFYGFGVMQNTGQRHIEFYGKVVDQDAKPVAGYQLRCKLQYHDLVHGPMLGAKGFWVTTDDEGVFHFDSRKDHGIGVMLGDSNQEEPENPGFFHPVLPAVGVGANNQTQFQNREHPILVSVIRLGPPMPMVMFWTKIDLPMGFRKFVRYVSVLEGQITTEPKPQSELEVRYEMREEKGYHVLHEYISALGDGGVQEVTGPDWWHAPESGYVKAIEVKPSGNGNRLYFQCHNRQVFGILTLESNSINCRANPRGIRNLHGMADQHIPTPVTLPYRDPEGVAIGK
jgi:hypothetical protein